MSWGSNETDPHGIISFSHRSDPTALVREQICDDRDCPRGCWVIKAYRRSHAILKALESLHRLDLADTDGDPHLWQAGLYTGSYSQTSWENTRRRFQPSRGGVRAAGVKVPTQTAHVVVALVETLDVGEKVPLPGGMAQLPLYTKSKSQEKLGHKPWSEHVFANIGPETALLDWRPMQFWQRRINSLWERRGGLTMSDNYIKSLGKLLRADTPKGLLFRLLLDRPVGQDAPNISGLGGFWTDPRKRHCLGKDTPLHPSQWRVGLQVLKNGQWEEWRGDLDEPHVYGWEQRWVVEEARPVWNLVYASDGKTKLCYHCGEETETFWQNQELGANGVGLGELASRVKAAHPSHRDDWYYPSADGTGFSVKLADWSYDEFLQTLAGKTTTTSKRAGPGMATVAEGLYDGLQPSVEEAEELSRHLMALAREG